MRLALIAAVAENGTIGRDNGLPWYLPEDLKYFKRVTLGKAIVMGRKTWDSIGRPLPGRTNIVVSRQPDLSIEGATVVKDLTAALELASRIATVDGSEELMVIGGAEIYQLALPLAQRLYLTEVHAVVAGDALFPTWDRAQWVQSSSEKHDADDSNPFDYSFVVYDRC
jgi:dihydrofolate reductase